MTEKIACPARRAVLRRAAETLSAVLLAPLHAARAEAWPTRPIRLIVPSAAGGGTDITARLVAQKLSASLGQQVFVDNRPGAGQMIGIEAVAKSPADGYTLLMAASTLALNPIMYRKVAYDPVRDFAPISEVASLPNVLVVNPQLPVKTVADLVKLAKAEPGRLAFASAGVGTSPHMSMELFKDMAGVDMLHVPYKGTTPAVVDVMGGQVPVMMANTLTVLSQVKAGRLRAIGISGLERIDALPGVPTVSEAGLPGYDSVQWYGLLAPAGTPAEVVARLAAEVVAALRLPDVKSRLADDGAQAVGSSPQAFAKLIADEIAKWTRVAKSAGIQPE